MLRQCCLLNRAALLDLVLHGCCWHGNGRGLEVGRQQLPARDGAALAVAIVNMKGASCGVCDRGKFSAVVSPLPRHVVNILLGYANVGV